MRYDSIIFDMDGTLWDAVDSYAAIWNRTLADCGLSRGLVTRDELIVLMGKPLKTIASILVPELDGEGLERFFSQLEANDKAMMPELGGRLYPGVAEALEVLSDSGVQLFLVSNCGPEGLPMFMDYTGLRPYFTDWLSYGSTGKDKDLNIRELVERYNLRKPLYVGDTKGDLLSTRRAGAAFAWASYGFGHDFDASEADHVLLGLTDLFCVLNDEAPTKEMNNNQKQTHPCGRYVADPELLLLSPKEQTKRLSRIRTALGGKADAVLLRDNANVYYVCGRVFSGYVYIPVAEGADPLYFVRRPNHLVDTQVELIRKPEEIPAILEQRGLSAPGRIALELGALSYDAATRLMKVFGEATVVDATPVMRSARSVKTRYEIEKLRASGRKQTSIYEKIPTLYREGMTDVEFQIEIERALRLEGCLGQFRVAGDEMELFMGNVLTGDNADNPSPYDFAMGGEGLDPSIPVGANGTLIRPNQPVMVDVNGNFTGYMTDMTRCYSFGIPSELTFRANECSRRICRELAEMGHPGIEAKALYNRAVEIAEEEGFGPNFMGYRSHAGFVGHGVGIEVNELPVIAPRSRDILQEGNVIALEPKFVLPGIGAVGIENTYVVRASGPMECITLAPEEITDLEPDI